MRKLRAAGVVTLGVLLCGCGGGDAGGGAVAGARIAPGGAAGRVEKSKALEPGRPVLRLPEDVKNSFETTRTGSSDADAVLRDNAARLNAISMAITSGDIRHSGLGFYSTGSAVESGYTLVRGILDKGRTVTGTTRYSAQRATVHSAKSATLTYCSDENEVFLKDRRTQRVLRDAPSVANYVRYTAELTRSDSGVWQTSSVTSDVGAKECRP